MVAAFIGVLAYQATWQLSGTARPEFIAFMQLHDRRQFNPAHWIERGRILDGSGGPRRDPRRADSGRARGAAGLSVRPGFRARGRLRGPALRRLRHRGLGQHRAQRRQAGLAKGVG
jgi:hypothetical protein